MKTPTQQPATAFFVVEPSGRPAFSGMAFRRDRAIFEFVARTICVGYDFKMDQSDADLVWRLFERNGWRIERREVAGVTQYGDGYGARIVVDPHPGADGGRGK